MDEKESTVSGSIDNSAESTESPPPISSVGEMMIPLTVHNQVTSQPNQQVVGKNLNSNASGMSSDSNKKKRGRPRKYDADGNLRVRHTPFHSVLASSMLQNHGETGFSLSFGNPGAGQLPMSSSPKRGRGRLSGAGNWQILSSLGEIFANTAGGDFTAHVVTVNTGEDVAGKILSFSQKGLKGICVLSANGAVSNVALRQPGSAGGILTYEGRFEILTLTGSYTVTETCGARSRTGGLSVSLASPDGRVIGGGIAGLLMAASPIQIVVGTFTPNCFVQQKKKQQRIPVPVSDAAAATRALPQVKTDNASLPSASLFPPHPVGGNKTVPQNDCWNGIEITTDQRPSPDINISLLNEDDAQGVI